MNRPLNEIHVHILHRLLRACDNLGGGAGASVEVHACHVKTNGYVQNAQRFLDPCVCGYQCKSGFLTIIILQLCQDVIVNCRRTSGI